MDSVPTQTAKPPDYSKSPRYVRVFWSVTGTVLVLGEILAGIWFGSALFIGVGQGVYWAIRFVFRTSAWGSLLGILVILVKYKLADRLPWTYR